METPDHDRPESSSPTQPSPEERERALRLEADRICDGLLRSYAEASQQNQRKDAEISRLKSALRDLQRRIVQAMH